MRILAASVLILSTTTALVLATSAQAQTVIVQHAVLKPPVTLRVLPPIEYDRPYDGQLTIIRAGSQAEVTRLCPPTPFPSKLGCAFRHAPGTCLIVLAADEVIKAAGWTHDIVRRHEIGHCNGWPKNHKGARAP